MGRSGGATGGTLLTAAEYNVVTYGADATGATESTAAISAAIAAAHANGGGTVLFPAGLYVTTNQIVYSNVVYQGDGPGATTITLKAGSTGAIFSGVNFASLTTTTPSTPSGASHWQMRDLTLDGHSAASASGTRCLEVFGYEFQIDNVHFLRAKTDGCWLEYHSTSDTPVNAQTTAWEEANVTNCKAFRNGADGFHFEGVHDSAYANLIAANNATNGFYCNSSGIYVNCHSWGTQVYAFRLVATERLVNCIAEGGTTAGVFVTYKDQAIIGGHIFYPGGGSAVGLKVGNASTLCDNLIVEGVLFGGSGANQAFSSSSGAAIDLTAASTKVNMRIKASVTQATGTVINGSIPTDASVEIQVGGGASPTSYYQIPGSGLAAANYGLWTPAKTGYLASPFDPALLASNRGFNKGIPFGVKCEMATSGTIGHIDMAVQTINGTPGATQNYVLVCDAAGNLIGYSQDMATLWGSLGICTANITVQAAGSLTLDAGSTFFVLIVANGTTVPKFWAAGVTDTTPFILNGALTAAQGFRNFQTAQTTVTTVGSFGSAFVLSTCVPENIMPWIGARA